MSPEHDRSSSRRGKHEHGVLDRARREPFSIWAELEVKPGAPRKRQDEGDRSAPERLDHEVPRLHGVGQLEAFGRIRERRGRIRIELELTEGKKL